MARLKGSRNKPKNTIVKTCTKCKKIKPLKDFYKRKDNAGYYSSHCKQCTLARHKEKRKENSDHRREQFLVKKYGVTLAQFDKMFEAQKGVCAICGQEETQKSSYGRVYRLSVDHNHRTKKIRGLLCKKCNMMIGPFGVDDKGTKLLLSATKYIEDSNE